jgi:threo-3-hydroxy-L-aspartate ammonia-lyase
MASNDDTLTVVSSLAVNFDDVASAAQRIAGIARVTPVMTSRTVDALTGAQVFFKCENLQRIGAFKFRGAYNALSQLAAHGGGRGVVTYSSGNHGQAIALAAKLLDLRAVVVMPHNAPAVKRAAVESYGARVVLYDPLLEQREHLAQQLAQREALAIVPPFNHPHIIAGQGTAAKELFEQAGALDYLLVPVGGGGLISGCALASKALAPRCKVIGVEPEAGDDATRSFNSKQLHTLPSVPDTIADGARTTSLGTLTFPILLAHVDAMLTTPDSALIRTLRFFAERMKLVVEPTGALAASVLFERAMDVRGARVGVILSGGNVDLRDLARYFSE